MVTLVLVSQTTTANAKYENHRTDLYKKVQVTNQMPMIPEDYEFINYYDLAKRYNEMAFNLGGYELGFIDKSYYNVVTNSFGMHTYAEDDTTIETSQAINTLAALISATLVNPDSISEEKLSEYVKMIETYYNVENGEGLMLNYPLSDTTSLSFWEDIYPGLLYFILMDKYDATVNSDDILKNTADRWYDVVMQLGGEDGNLDLSYTGYDFVQGEPYDNGEWVEPDAAAGIALMQYYAYEKFQDKKYLSASFMCMDYLDNFLRHPGYEMLYLYLPYLSARLNATQRQTYDTAKYVDWFFNESDLRENYGMFASNVGFGLMGDTVKYGGTADALSSIVGATAIVPMLKYDQRYAREVGRYLLHFTNEYKHFYPQYLDPDMQTDADISKRYDDLIPYEKLNITEDILYGFGEGEATNLSVVAGSYIGMLGAMISETNVDGILRVNLNTNDYYSDDYESYLLFNPYDETKTLQYDIATEGNVSLYDTVSQSFIEEKTSGTVEIEIDPNEAVIIVEIVEPDGSYDYEIKREVERNVKAKQYISVDIPGLSTYEPLIDETPIELDMKTSQGAAITNIEIYIDEKQVFKNVSYETPYIIKVDELVSGYHLVKVVIKSNTGLVDTAYARVFIENGEEVSPLNVRAKEMLEWKSYNGGSVAEDQGESRVAITGDNGGVVSEQFSLDFSKVPLLYVDVPIYTNSWSAFIEVPELNEKFYILKDCEDAGEVLLNLNYILPQLNPKTFNLKGEHDVVLGFEVPDGGELLVNRMRIVYENRQPLTYRQWKTPLSTKNLIKFQSKFNGLGKLNYYDGYAQIKNMNPEGSGGIETYYFTVDFNKKPEFTIKVAETDGLWSVLMYVEGEKESYFVQYPTKEIGKFTYNLTDVLKRANVDLQDETERDIHFFIQADGGYESTVKIDYMTLSYQKPWYEWAFIGSAVLLVLTGVFKNMHKRF